MVRVMESEEEMRSGEEEVVLIEEGDGAGASAMRRSKTVQVQLEGVG